MKRKLISLLTLGALGLTLGVSLVNKNQNNEFKAAKASVDPILEAATKNFAGFEIVSGSMDDLYDGDEDTYFEIENVSTGTYLEFEFDEETVIHDITIVFKDYGFLKNGQVLWSTEANMNKFTTIDTFSITSPQTITMRAYGVKAKRIKLIPRDDNDGDVVKIHEIRVNRGLFSDDLVQGISFGDFANDYLADDIGITSLNYMLDGNKGNYTRFGSRKDKCNPYIQFDFKETTALSSISYQNINLVGTTNDRLVSSKLQYLNNNQEYVDLVSDGINKTTTYDTYDIQMLDF